MVLALLMVGFVFLIAGFSILASPLVVGYQVTVGYVFCLLGVGLIIVSILPRFAEWR